MEQFFCRCASCNKKFLQTEERKKQYGNYCQDCIERVDSIVKYSDDYYLLKRLEAKLIKNKEPRIEMVFLREDLEKMESIIFARWGINMQEEIKKRQRFYNTLVRK